MKNQIIVLFGVIIVGLTQTATAQSGGNYQITQSVIGAGGQESTAGNFSLTGVIGQPLAGTNSTGGNFSVRGGFFTAQLAPTAAQVSISGSVFSGKGLGIIRRVRIILVDTSTGIQRTTQTNDSGFYRFDELEVGRLYVVRAESRNYSFTPDSHIFELSENQQDVNFTGSRIFLPNQN